MEGRWTVISDPDGAVVPVVPCDDAAIERAARALYMHAREGAEHEMPPWSGTSNARKELYEDRARLVLRAAGETP